VSRSARVLFNFADTAILLLNDTGYLLTGTSVGEHRKRLAEFSIPLGAGGAIAETALQRRVTFISRDGNLPGVAEEQLLRILGTECLVCLPLVSEGRCLGVFIGGAASGQLADFMRCEGSLQAFAAQAAIALKTAASEHGEASRRIASVTEEYREASRRVAHEVNNPLSIIKNYLSVLDRKLAKQEPVSAEISILNEEIDRVGQIIGGLADLQPVSREGTAEVNRVISDVIRLFRDTGYVPASVRIMDRLQDQPFEIDSDGDTLKQIMVNLIKNAIEALPDGGEIEIGNNGLVNRDGLLYVEIRIKDTGPGISPEVMANLFSPVRSTKGEAHRGLGLSIVHGLVKKIHGLIICRSNKEGTAFEILLPVPSRTDQAIVSQSPARNSA
jgi:signal transduction histidine kinase